MAKRKYFFPIVFLLLLVAMFFSLRYGAVTSKWSDVTQALLHFDSNNQGEQLIRYLRLPRMLGAISVGAAFAISGALIQGITSNLIWIISSPNYFIGCCFEFFFYSYKPKYQFAF